MLVSSPSRSKCVRRIRATLAVAIVAAALGACAQEAPSIVVASAPEDPPAVESVWVSGRLLFATDLSLPQLDFSVVAKRVDRDAGSEIAHLVWQPTFTLALAPGVYAFELDGRRLLGEALNTPFVLWDAVTVPPDVDELDIGTVDLTRRLFRTKVKFAEVREREDVVLDERQAGLFPILPEAWLGGRASPLFPLHTRGSTIYLHPRTWAQYYSDSVLRDFPESVLHGPGAWIVPVEARGFRPTTAYLNGGSTEVLLEREEE